MVSRKYFVDNIGSVVNISEYQIETDIFRKKIPKRVYSVFRTYEHNKFLELDLHLSRSELSLKLLGWSPLLNSNQLYKALHDVCTASPWQNTKVRYDIFEKPLEMYGSTFRILLSLEPFVEIPSNLYERGVNVKIASSINRTFSLIKTTDFIEVRESFLRKKEENIYEYLLVDEKNQILEGMTSNFFGVLDNAIWAAKNKILLGVTREIILKLLVCYNVCFRSIPIEEISNLSEAWISSSTRGIIPVVNINDTLIGNGYPGLIYQNLSNKYQEFIKKSIRLATSY